MAVDGNFLFCLDMPNCNNKIDYWSNRFSLPSRKIRTLGQVPLSLTATVHTSVFYEFRVRTGLIGQSVELKLSILLVVGTLYTFIAKQMTRKKT